MKAFAIDLGGSHATCALVEDRTVLESEVLKIDRNDRLAPLLPLFARTLTSLVEKSGGRLDDVSGLALAICCLVDPDQGRVVSTLDKYVDAPDLSLTAWARESLGVAFAMENDVRLALLGERYAGAAQDSDDVVMFTLGTGIGGAALLGGKLLRSKHWQGGVLGGHVPVVLGGRACNCGGVGCAEAEAASWSLPLVAKDWPGFGQSALAREPVVNFRALFHHARAGDQVAVELRDRCISVWAAAAVAGAHAFDPEIIVFGGGVMKSGEEILPKLRAHVERHTFAPWGKVQVRAAALGDQAALLGAVPLLQGLLAPSSDTPNPNAK